MNSVVALGFGRYTIYLVYFGRYTIYTIYTIFTIIGIKPLPGFTFFCRRYLWIIILVILFHFWVGHNVPHNKRRK